RAVGGRQGRAGPPDPAVPHRRGRLPGRRGRQHARRRVVQDGARAARRHRRRHRGRADAGADPGGEPDRGGPPGGGRAAVSLVVGLDIGGTKTAAGVVDRSGAVLAAETRATPAADGPGAILGAAAELVRALDGRRGIVAAVGVGSAGVIDPRTGRVLSATGTLAGWAGTDLRGELSRRLGLPVEVANDVHAHALGEQWRGAAAGRRDVLLVAVGTGVGASVVLDGRVRYGAHAVAGHAGHVPSGAAAGL